MKSLRVVVGLLMIGFLLVVSSPAPLWGQGAAEEIRIGYLLSKKAGFSTQDRAGAAMGVKEINLQAAHLGKRFSLLFAQGGKSTEVVAEAKRLLDQEQAVALMGSVSGAATIALARLAEERGVVFFNIGSSVDSLRGSKCGRNTFSIGPSLTMRVRSLGQWIVYGQGWKRWAVIAGKSRTEQRLAQAAGDYLTANGGQVAIVLPAGDAEAYEPAGLFAQVDAVKPDFLFVALTGEKQTLVLDGYNRSGLAYPIGGALPEMARFDRHSPAAAGYWSVGWNHLQRRYGASELNNRFVDFAGMRMDERAWAAWAGVKILGEAMLRVESPSPQALVSYLQEHVQFDGYKGVAMNFRSWNNQLRQPMHVVEFNDEPGRNGWDTLVPVGRIPLRGLKGWKGNPLDSFAKSRTESGCAW